MQSITTREDKHMETLKMVEKSIKESKNYPTEPQLWRSLRKNIHRVTLRKILKQLETDNKIIRDKDGSIVWTFVDTPEAEESLRQSVLLR